MEPAYLEGIRLFNERQFWEAHEAWEEIWLERDGLESEFLQGLIQSSAALLKYSRHEFPPAQRLYTTAMGRLSLCPDVYMDLDVRAFQRAMEACFRPLLAGSGGTPGPLDSANIPRIELRKGGAGVPARP